MKNKSFHTVTVHSRDPKTLPLLLHFTKWNTAFDACQILRRMKNVASAEVDGYGYTLHTNVESAMSTAKIYLGDFS